MSRYYNLCVEARGLTVKEINSILIDKFGWSNVDEVESSSADDYTSCTYEGSLYGGFGEQEAHEEIYAELKKLNKKAKIMTRFTYLEDLPYNEYGDIDTDTGVVEKMKCEHSLVDNDNDGKEKCRICNEVQP